MLNYDVLLKKCCVKFILAVTRYTPSNMFHVCLISHKNKMFFNSKNVRHLAMKPQRRYIEMR